MKPRESSSRATDKLRRFLRSLASGDLEALVSSFDWLEEAVFIVDADRNTLLYNRKAEELTGLSRDDVLGKHCLTGFKCVKCLKSCGVFTKETIINVPLDVIRDDGTTIKVLKSARVLRDKDGDPIGAIEIFWPADPPEAEISEAEEKELAPGSLFGGMDRILGALGRSFLILDRDFAVRYISPSLSETVDLEPKEVIGRPATLLLGGGICASGGPFREALERGERREGWRASLLSADGAEVSVSISGAPLRTDTTCDEASGECSEYLLMIRPDTQLEGRTDDAEPLFYEGMIARSQSMRRIFQLVDHLRDSDATVLITGESGTGKELVARAVHARSTHANHPFVAVNCGALPGDLLESELFGHARGAFTGAIRDKPGRFEVVGEGTILLDEIGDLPLHLQVKLLRVLQERTFERVGETKEREVAARVVAATHQNLSRLVEERLFREDLFYRLNVVRIRVPPLRERREDVEVLIQHLLEKIGQRRSRALRISPSAMRVLMAYDWPGNVRQLENALEFATTVCGGSTIHSEDLPPEVVGWRPEETPRPMSEPPPVYSAVPRMEDAESVGSSLRGGYPSEGAIRDALQRSRYRRAKAAELLGVSRTTLWRRMRELDLS